MTLMWIFLTILKAIVDFYIYKKIQIINYTVVVSELKNIVN